MTWCRKKTPVSRYSIPLLTTGSVRFWSNGAWSISWRSHSLHIQHFNKHAPSSTCAAANSSQQQPTAANRSTCVNQWWSSRNQLTIPAGGLDLGLPDWNEWLGMTELTAVGKFVCKDQHRLWDQQTALTSSFEAKWAPVTVCYVSPTHSCYICRFGHQGSGTEDQCISMA